MTASRKLAAILAADVVGYSRLMGEDEAGTALAVRERREAAAPIVAAHGGRIFKTMGDGMLMEFPSVVAAAEFAIAIQKTMAERNAGVAEEKRILYRIGVHLGDVLIEGDDILGDGVNIAARLEGIAEPGGVCVSGGAYEHVRGRVEAEFVDLGEHALKNIARRVHVYAAHIGASGPSGGLRSLAIERTEVPRASIAVLPFANLSGDPEQEYFADGISEDIITELSKLPELFVIARNSSFTFKGKNVLVTEVGKSLGVGHVLEGSVRKSAGRVRISAQLVDASSGGHIWAERFDRDLTDIFAVQDEVTANIVAALAPNLSEAARRRAGPDRTTNLEAYDCFLRGREMSQRLARDSNAAAKAWFTRAIELDPKFASAHAFLALVLVNEFISDWSDSPAESLEEARAAARRAVELDRRNPYAQWVFAIANLGMSGNVDGAQQALRETIAFNPSFAPAYNALGVALHFAGRSGEALTWFERSYALDPNYPEMWLHYQAQALYQLDRFPEAAEVLKRRILRNPDTDASRALLAACYGQMGLIEQAHEAWREALRVNPDYSLEQRRKAMRYQEPRDFEKFVEGLRKAGLPAR